ncbi:MAG: amino acid ABC transporter permease [Clostridiales Family XIII bacterium]|jgi:polar amino acid transport system permease protein|nr:amino acid ABC transporter permease [Clostridiales Family XIII bacterium]
MLWAVTLNLLKGFSVTCGLFALTLVLGIPLGLLICFGLMNTWEPFKHSMHLEGRFTAAFQDFRPVSAIINVIVWVVRGTPLLLQLLIVYFAIPMLAGYQVFDRFEAAVVTFTVNYACYFAVIFRGGIQSVPRGQTEAGLVIGMTKGQIFRYVTLLQFIKRIMPPISNEIITLVKDTALARVISVLEIIYYGYRYVTKDALVWPLFYTGVFYLVFVGVLTILFAKIEKKLDYIKIV